MAANARQGLALLMVVVVVAALTVVAVPFLASMRLAERSSRGFLDGKRAQWIARGAFNHAVASLHATHDHVERENLINSITSGASPAAGQLDTPDFDDYHELIVTPPQVTLTDGTSLSLNDPKGEMWSVETEDEQAKVNVNSATPWLVANLMGVTELSASVEVDETVIPTL
jgi:Tfp pilus assembly protein PilX